jgi:mannose/fructose/N-acetylgalactosamine-specific phosphotransferase system component IIC
LSGWELLSAGSTEVWVTIFSLGLLGALLSLDETAVLQSWLSQPLPAGLLAGIIGGDPVSGATLGLLVQLLVLSNIPVGQFRPGEQVAAVVAGVGAMTLSGHSLPANPLAATSAPGLSGWLLLAVALCSLAGRWVVAAERRVHLAWMLQGHRSLRDGSLARFERLHLRCLLAIAGRGLLLVLVWLVIILLLWLPLYERLPALAIAALNRLTLLVPALAVGLLVDRYGPRLCWPYLISGLLVTFLTLQVLG